MSGDDSPATGEMPVPAGQVSFSKQPTVSWVPSFQMTETDVQGLNIPLTNPDALSVAVSQRIRQVLAQRIQALNLGFTVGPDWGYKFLFRNLRLPNIPGEENLDARSFDDAAGFAGVITAYKLGARIDGERIDASGTGLFVMAFTVTHQQADRRDILLGTTADGTRVFADGPESTEQHEKWHLKGPDAEPWNTIKNKLNLLGFHADKPCGLNHGAFSAASQTRQLKSASVFGALTDQSALDAMGTFAQEFVARAEFEAMKHGIWHGLEVYQDPYRRAYYIWTGPKTPINL